MANGLKPIGESIKPIIDRIKKEREERRKRKGNKPIRTQPKLPGMKKGGSMENPKKVDRIAQRLKNKDRMTEADIQRARKIKKIAGALGTGASPVLGGVQALKRLGRAGARTKSKDPNKDKRSPGRPGGKGKKEDKRRKIRYMTPLAKKAQGGMAFGGEKRIPGSGAAFRGTGFKGIF